MCIYHTKHDTKTQTNIHTAQKLAKRHHYYKHNLMIYHQLGRMHAISFANDKCRYII